MKDSKTKYGISMADQGPIVYDGPTIRIRIIGDQYFIHTFNKHSTAIHHQCMIIIPEKTGKEYMQQLTSDDSTIVSMIINILANDFTVLHYNTELNIQI